MAKPDRPRLLRAEIEDFKRVELVALDLAGGSLVEIAGNNGAGKSSVLDAVEATLGGARYAPKEPIRRGAARARVVLETDALIVERVWTAKTDRLVVKTRDGFAAAQPQAHLSEMVGALAFDPVGFVELPPAEQRATLLRLAGVDLDALDAERQGVYDARRDVNRDLREAEAQLAAVPEVEAPAEEVSVSALSAELTEAMVAAEAARKATDERCTIERALAAAKDRIAEIRQELGRVEAHADRLAAELVEAQTAEAGAVRVVPDLDEIRARLAGAEEINRAVRQRQERDRLAARVAALRSTSERHSEELEAIEARKRDTLAAAEMPVEGLGIDETGVTYRDVPLEQASQAERIRVGVAIAAALSPGLRLALVRQGNDLDAASLAALRAEAERLDLQVLLERIVPSSEAAVVIEEGRVRGEGGGDGG